MSASFQIPEWMLNSFLIISANNSSFGLLIYQFNFVSKSVLLTKEIFLKGLRVSYQFFCFKTMYIFHFISKIALNFWTWIFKNSKSSCYLGFWFFVMIFAFWFMKNVEVSNWHPNLSSNWKGNLYVRKLYQMFRRLSLLQAVMFMFLSCSWINDSC